MVVDKDILEEKGYHEMKGAERMQGKPGNSALGGPSYTQLTNRGFIQWRVCGVKNVTVCTVSTCWVLAGPPRVRIHPAPAQVHDWYLGTW